MMGRMSRAIALLGVALWLGWSGEALAAARVALVVGNGEYAQEIGKLKNPTSDAQLMADTLKSLGFEPATVHPPEKAIFGIQFLGFRNSRVGWRLKIGL